MHRYGTRKNKARTAADGGQPVSMAKRSRSASAKRPSAARPPIQIPVDGDALPGSSTTTPIEIPGDRDALPGSSITTDKPGSSTTADNSLNEQEGNVVMFPTYTIDNELPIQIPSVSAALGHSISKSVKDKIMAGQFVDLGNLVNTSSSVSAQHVSLSSTGQLMIQTKAPSKLTSIEQWTDAFLVYASIYLAAHPHKMQEILKYMHIIRLGHQRHGGLGWREYEEQFRIRMALDPTKSWAVIDSELWLLFMHNPTPSVQPLSRSTPSVKPLSGSGTSFCYDMNYKGACSRPACSYKHKCMKCGGTTPRLSVLQFNILLGMPRLPRACQDNPFAPGHQVIPDSELWALGSTPINFEVLDKYLSIYPNKESAVQLSRGFQEGFRLQFVGCRAASFSSNLKSVTEHPDIVRVKIKNEVQCGRIMGPFSVPPISNLRVSPIGVVPKSDGGWRLITHLSYPDNDSINDRIDNAVSTVHYTSFDKVADMVFRLGKSALMAKRDVKSAFRLLPIHPGDYHLLGMYLEGKYYIDKCLPMGCKISCRLFEMFSSFLQWLVSYKTQKQTLDHYLDDFFFAGAAGTTHCQELASCFNATCEELKVPIAAEKSAGPSTIMVFLGLELDSDELIIRIPQNKVTQLLELLASLSNRKKVSKKELESLVGKLNFVCRAVRSSRAFLRRFYDLLKGLKKPYHKVRFSQSIKEDISIWIAFLTDFNGITHIPEQVWYNSETLQLFTDSAGRADLGCGCYFSGKWCFYQWPASWVDCQILQDMTCLEMVPVLLAVMLWGPTLSNKRILLHIDNEALVIVLNKQSSRSIRLMYLVRQFVLLTMKFNIIFRSVHIASSLNYVADSISRKQWSRFRQLAPDAEANPAPLPEGFHSLLCKMKLTDS